MYTSVPIYQYVYFGVYFTLKKNICYEYYDTLTQQWGIWNNFLSNIILIFE